MNDFSTSSDTTEVAKPQTSRTPTEQEHIDKISLDMAAGHLNILIEDVDDFNDLKPTILIYAKEGTFPIFYNQPQPDFQEALEEIKHATRNLHVYFYMGYYVVSDKEIMLIKFDNGVYRTCLVEYEGKRISRKTTKVFFQDSIDPDFKLTELHAICNA